MFATCYHAQHSAALRSACPWQHDRPWVAACFVTPTCSVFFIAPCNTVVSLLIIDRLSFLSEGPIQKGPYKFEFRFITKILIFQTVNCWFSFSINKVHLHAAVCVCKYMYKCMYVCVPHVFTDKLSAYWESLRKNTVDFCVAWVPCIFKNFPAVDRKRMTKCVRIIYYLHWGEGITWRITIHIVTPEVLRRKGSRIYWETEDYTYT